MIYNLRTFLSVSRNYSHDLHLGCSRLVLYHSFFFFNDTATTEIYTLSLHDALPTFPQPHRAGPCVWLGSARSTCSTDRKSTRLNSSHGYISYAVFCLKKKNPPRTDNSAVLSPARCCPPRHAPSRHADHPPNRRASGA